MKKKKAGRPNLEGGVGESVRYTLRIPARELEAAQQEADKVGQPLSTWIRDTIRFRVNKESGHR